MSVNPGATYEAGVAPGLHSCLSEALRNGYTWTPEGGFNLFYIPYSWCMSNCSGIYIYPAYAIEFVLFQFVLPALIFSTGISRKWHLELPTKLEYSAGNPYISLLFFGVNSILLGVIKTVDMLGWVIAIFTLAGPILLSAIQEMLLDFRVLSFLTVSSSTNHLSHAERLDLIQALLCGSFENKDKDLGSRVNNQLSIMGANFDTVKTKLRLMLTSQPEYGVFVGIPTIFFLGGFLYNNISTVSNSAVGAFYQQFAVWWLVPVLLAIASGTVLTGANSSVTSAVTSEVYAKSKLSWNPIQDYFDGEVYPVSGWDRARKKLERITQTHAWKQPDFQKEVSLGVWSWVFSISMALVITLTPPLLAFELTYLLSWPREPCRTLTYYIYAGSQLVLILIAALRSKTGRAYSILIKPRVAAADLQRYGVVTQQVLLALELLFRWSIIILSFFALLGSFAVSSLGNIAQIFGIYSNCLCETSLTQWALPPASRTTIVAIEALNLSDVVSREDLANRFTWGLTGTIAGMCYLGWAYQRAMRRSILQQIDNL